MSFSKTPPNDERQQWNPGRVSSLKILLKANVYGFVEDECSQLEILPKTNVYGLVKCFGLQYITTQGLSAQEGSVRLRPAMQNDTPWVRLAVFRKEEVMRSSL